MLGLASLINHSDGTVLRLSALRWIERFLERHQLVTVTHDDHGIAYLISQVGRDPKCTTFRAIWYVNLSNQTG